jgi:hypothetical protein
MRGTEDIGFGTDVIRVLTKSALEGADLFIHYHPNEQKDAEDVKAYIAKVASSAKVELYPKDLRTEEACVEMVEAVKKWSNKELHVL